MDSKTIALIDLNAARENFRKLRHWCPGFFCPMIKANAYGHGDVKIAELCIEEGVERLGVMRLSEALHLKRNGIAKEIIVFDRLDREELRTCIKEGFTPVLHHVEQLKDWPSSGSAFHLKIDTGMNRLGAEVKELTEFADAVARGLPLRGLLTHFLDGATLDRVDRQLEHLQTAAKTLGVDTGQVMFHAFNTPALQAWLAAGRKLDDRIGGRFGGALYGLACSLGGLDLKSVMTLKSQIIHIQRLDIGETVSYNGTWQAGRRSVVGVIPVGYADGYPRTLSNLGRVLYRGELVPVVGTVCMDFTMVDLTDYEDVCVGEDVILFGDDKLSADEVASWLKTTPYAITTEVSPRVPRSYLGCK